MSAARKRRPPKQRCGNCGGDYYGWRAGDVCARCRRELAPDRSALVQVIKDRRGPSLGRTDAPLPYGELSEGF